MDLPRDGAGRRDGSRDGSQPSALKNPKILPVGDENPMDKVGKSRVGLTRGLAELQLRKFNLNHKSIQQSWNCHPKE